MLVAQQACLGEVRGGRFQVFQLQQQAFTQVARRDAGRIACQQPLAHGLERGRVAVQTRAARLDELGMRRGEIPVGATRLTMFIDVQGKLLYWLAAAFEEDFTGYVVDYGAWPDQRRAYFTLRDAQRTLQSAAKGTGLEGAIYAGLEALTGDYLNREWRRDAGAMMRIERCLIDANWGTSTDVVYQFCRQSPHAAVLLPSHGRFVGAASMPFPSTSAGAAIGSG